MLQSPQPPPSEVMLTALVNEIAAVPQPFMLILDDYHVIHTPTIHQQLAFLLDHQPANLHLVITTREDPLLPISRLRARGQVLEIRQDDLRFTAEETAEFLKTVMGLDLSPDEIAALERRTEGWIAGLQLAALSMQGRDDLTGFIQAFTGSSRFILDYLIEEVFEKQSPDVKDFLLKTSILERLSGPLCDGWQNKPTVRNCLKGWSRPICLSFRLTSHVSGIVITVCLLSYCVTACGHRHSLKMNCINAPASGMRNNNYPSEAIHHSLAAHDWEHAANLISANSDVMLKRGEVLTVIGWFQSLAGRDVAVQSKIVL